MVKRVQDKGDAVVIARTWPASQAGDESHLNRDPVKLPSGTKTTLRGVGFRLAVRCALGIAFVGAGERVTYLTGFLFAVPRPAGR